MPKKRILVALSGGVDSALAAALLKKQGYEVTSVFMINWRDEVRNDKIKPCQWEQDYTDAQKVAQKLNIKLFTWDFTKEYKKYVFDYFIKSYEQGLTPNPDTLCNKYIKFGAFLEKALNLGFEKIATGHYAKTLKHKNTHSASSGQVKTLKQREEIEKTCPELAEGLEIRNQEEKKVGKPEINVTPTFRSDKTEFYKLITAKDKTKDQTYFLYELGQHELEHTIFPLGDLTKKKVRQLARQFNLPVAEKKDSYGICFVGEKNMKKFLRQFIKSNPGEIIDKKGQVLGQHQGLYLYTLGQRERIGIGGSGPYYVVRKDYQRNQLVVTHDANDLDLHTQEFMVSNLNWLSGIPPKMPCHCQVRCRHLQKLNEAWLEWYDKNQLKVILKNSLKAVTPGQVAVFYQPLRKFFNRNFEVLGGGIIHKNTESTKST